MAVVVLDERLRELVDEDVVAEKIATGYVFTEGPVWHARERHLTFSDIYDEHGGSMYRWSEGSEARLFRRPSNHANGNTYDHQGRLITCEHDRRVVRTNPDGSIEPLVERYGNARLNSPNDVIVAPNGDIIFTDPPYGLRQPDGSIVGKEYPENGVFRFSEATGSLTMLTGAVESPNGLAMTDDASRLYVCDTPNHVVHVFDVLPDGSVTNQRRFCELRHGDAVGRPDGMKLDARGNVYVCGNSPEGIWVFSPDGDLLGLIGTGEEMNRQGTGPGGPANMCWGGDDWRTVFATAVTSVYRLRLKVAGQPVRIA